MLPSKPPENPWQEVRRGKQKNQGLSQAASEGRGLQNTRPSSQSGPSGRGPLRAQPLLQNTRPSSQTGPGDQNLAKAQPLLHATPNGRIMPPKYPPAQPVPDLRKRKENIPYEIRNAREWDPEKRLLYGSSSESSDDDDDSEYNLGSNYGERPLGSVDINGTTRDHESQQAFSQRSKPQPKANVYGKPSGPRRRHLRANFHYKRDNFARASFRKRLAPTGKFTLPKDCHEIEPNRKRMYDTFDEIGVRLGSFIRPPQYVKDHELLLWGNPRQIQDTKDELQRWLDHRLQNDLARKSTAKDKFVRELSSIGDPYLRLMNKMQREAKLFEFQQVPAQGRFFPYTGTFLWETDEVRPEDILGPSLEAFDPIRLHYQCHIVFDHKLSSFRIFSDNEDAIKKTMNRLIGTMREYVAKNVRPDRVILVEPPSLPAIRKDIKVVPVPSNNHAGEKSMRPEFTGSALGPDGFKQWRQKSHELTMRNNRRMEQSLWKCITRLPHYRGLVQIRIHFGTFALKVYRQREGTDSTPFEEFFDDLTMPGTKAVMIRDLQIRKDATTIMAKIQAATDLFLPMNSSSTSLEEVTPSFSACFTFEDPEKRSTDYILELSSSPAAPTIYEKVQELWIRTGRRDNAVPLEVLMARLGSGASWKLEVSAENSIDASRINPKMMEFAEGVRLSKIPRTRTELTGQKVFTWRKDLPGIMQPTAFQQKTALRYRLAYQSDWEFEIARYDSYGNPKSESAPVETNWGATLYNTNWDSVLTDNSTLGIGEAAGWNPELGTFFPAGPGTTEMEGVEGTDPGVMELFKVVEGVSKFIDSIKKEEPYFKGHFGGKG